MNLIIEHFIPSEECFALLIFNL